MLFYGGPVGVKKELCSVMPENLLTTLPQNLPGSLQIIELYWSVQGGWRGLQGCHKRGKGGLQGCHERGGGVGIRRRLS